LFDLVVPRLVESARRFGTLTDAIVYTHVRLMAELPDTLIARKAGTEVAQRSAQLARHVLDAGSPGDEAYYEALANFDFWLRSDGRRRNPGTTADLIAAGLFVLLRDELIDPPYR
jgi:triphosphoribosyl-dephospho-CoA synthase